MFIPIDASPAKPQDICDCHVLTTPKDETDKSGGLTYFCYNVGPIMSDNIITHGPRLGHVWCDTGGARGFWLIKQHRAFEQLHHNTTV